MMKIWIEPVDHDADAWPPKDWPSDAAVAQRIRDLASVPTRRGRWLANARVAAAAAFWIWMALYAASLWMTGA